MLSFQSGQTTVTIHFKPLIIVGILIGSIFLFQMIRAIIILLKFKQISKDCANGNYSNVIRIGEPLRKTYRSFNGGLSTKNIAKNTENLNLALAISYFALSNDEMFLNRIHELKLYTDIKEFWLALFYLQKNDYESFRDHANKISNTEYIAVNKAFLDAYLAYNQQQFEIAHEKMEAIADKLTIPVLKQIANEVLH